MTGITFAQAASILKRLYPDERVKFMGYKGHPFLDLVPKMESFDGAAMQIPIHWGGHTGVAAPFATAQSVQAGGKYSDFLITRVNHYGVTTVQMEAYEAAMKAGKGAFIALLEAETDGLLQSMGNQLSRALFRNHGGAVGQVGAVSTVTLTLKNKADIVNFEVGQVINSSNTDGTSGSVDAQDVTILTVDRDAGTLTQALTWTASGNFSDDDFLFHKGNFGACLSGLASWIPSTAPSATAFFGCDRSLDVTRLGGVRYDGSSDSIEEALQATELRLNREGANPNIALMNHDDYGALRNSLGSRVVYDRVKSTVAPMSFKSIVLQGINDVNILIDRDCPKGKAYMLQTDTWKLCSLGSAPRFSDNAGLGSHLIMASEDAVEWRALYRAQLACHAPGKNAVITLPTA